jgi:hypothetical protein
MFICWYRSISRHKRQLFLSHCCIVIQTSYQTNLEKLWMKVVIGICLCLNKDQQRCKRSCHAVQSYRPALDKTSIAVHQWTAKQFSVDCMSFKQQDNIIIFSWKDPNNEDIRNELDNSPLSEKTTEYRKKWKSYLQRMKHTRISLQAYKYQPSGKRDICRQIIRWRKSQQY